MLAQEKLPGSVICCAFGGVGGEEVAGEVEVVREALVSVEVELQVELRPAAVDVAEVGFEFGAVEGVDDLTGEGGEVLLALLTNVEARELVVEGGAREAGDGAAVDLFLLGGEVVLLEEVGEADVEEWVVGVAVELAAEDGEGFGEFVLGGETTEVAIEDLAVGEVVGCGWGGDSDGEIEGAGLILIRCGFGEVGGVLSGASAGGWGVGVALLSAAGGEGHALCVAG